MNAECQDQSCKTNECSPNSCEQPKSCETQSACQSQCPTQCDCKGCQLVCLAKEAKLNVLGRKMEAIIEKKYGAKLEKEAELLVEHLFKLWELKRTNKAALGAEMEQFHSKFMALMRE